MSWQTTLYKKLRSREWYKVGDLFEQMEAEIPLHKATRWYLSQRGNKGKPVPFGSEARWRYFRYDLSRIGVERENRTRHRLDWNDRIRLAYVKGSVCAKCGGPVIRGTWSTGRLTACLSCEAAPQPTPPPPKKPPKLRMIPVVKPQPSSTPPPPEPPLVIIDLAKMNSIKEAHDAFFLVTKHAPKFQNNPKLVRLLHRALEAGTWEEYVLIGIYKEVELLRATDPVVTAERAQRWSTTKVTSANKRWIGLIQDAYIFGMVVTLEFVTTRRLELVKPELEELRKKLEPVQSVKPNRTVRQRFMAATKNALGRFRMR